MKRTLSYVTELGIVCARARKSEPRVEECGDIEQGSYVPPIEPEPEQPLSASRTDASLIWDNQVFHVADCNGVPDETIKFDAETQLQGYCWEVLVPGHDIQYWFSGKDFTQVKHKLPRDSVVLRHLQKRALNSYFPVASKSEKLHRLVAKATMAAFSLGILRSHMV